MKYLKYPLSIITIGTLFYITGLSNYYQEIANIEYSQTPSYTEIQHNVVTQVNFDYDILGQKLKWNGIADHATTSITLEDDTFISINIYERSLDIQFYLQPGQILTIYYDIGTITHFSYSDFTVYCTAYQEDKINQEFFDKCNTTVDIEKYYNIAKEIINNHQKIYKTLTNEIEKNDSLF